MPENKDPLEALYRLHGSPGYYIYIQYLSDDPEYVIDYTIFNDNFEDVDGGLIGEDLSWNFARAMDVILSEGRSSGTIKSNEVPYTIDLEKFRDKLGV